MGIDFLDCVFRIDKNLGISLANLQYQMHDAPRNRRGTLIGATAADLSWWVERCIAA